MYIALIVRRMADDHVNYYMNLFTTKTKAIDFQRYQATKYFNFLLNEDYLKDEHNNNKLEQHITIEEGKRYLKDYNIATLKKLFKQFTFGEYLWYISDDQTPR